MNYFEQPGLSNSQLNWLDPDLGGSPRTFLLNTTNKEEQKETTSLSRGKLLHLCMFEPDKYVVSDTEPPSENIMYILDESFKILKEDIIKWFEIASLGDAVPPNIEEYIEELPGVILEFARQQNYGQSWKPETVVKKVLEQLEYLSFLVSADGKVIVNQATRDIIVRCKESLESNKAIAELFMRKNGFDKGEAHNELEIFFPWTINVGKITKDVQMKSKLDRVIYYPEEKLLVVLDLKTTSKPISKFRDAFEYYKVYRQLAVYTRAAVYWANQNNLEVNQVQQGVIAVETIEPFESRMFWIDPEYIQKGRNEADYLVSVYDYAERQGFNCDPPEVINGTYFLKLNP